MLLERGGLDMSRSAAVSTTAKWLEYRVHASFPLPLVALNLNLSSQLLYHPGCFPRMCFLPRGSYRCLASITKIIFKTSDVVFAMKENVPHG